MVNQCYVHVFQLLHQSTHEYHHSGRNTRLNPMTLKVSIPKKTVKFGRKRKLKEGKKILKERHWFFSLRLSPMQKCQGENFPTQSPGYKHVEGQWHSAKLRRLSSDLFELTTPIWHKGTHFTDEEQGNHSQSQSYKQVPPNPWILGRTEAG